MMTKKSKNKIWVFLLIISILSINQATAQSVKKKLTTADKITDFLSSFKINGDIQTDMLLSETDSTIGAYSGKKRFKSNSYIRLAIQNKILSMGIKGAYLKNPLPGYEPEFAGAGIYNFYINAHLKYADITLGDFYEQLGNGLIFKTYEERNLGIDNSLRGGKIVLKPIKGLYVKGLAGKQKYYFKDRKSMVMAADVEANFENWVDALSRNDWYISFGNSFVTKTEPDEIVMANSTQRLNFPKFVPAFSTRLNVQKNNFSLMSEYAYKWNDPSFDNHYTYKSGSALFISANYSKKGISLLLQAKRSENMSYRSVRSKTGNSLYINNLPPFSMQHSYTLAAHYPYATQPIGEWAFQGEFRYRVKRKTLLGGRYGTNVRLNFSYIMPLQSDEKQLLNSKGELGYIPRFFETGNSINYTDANIEITKKISPNFSLLLMYMNQNYNQKRVEGHAENGDIIRSNIFVFDGKYRVNKNLIVRSELQYLNTKQDLRDWMYGMLEFSIKSKLMISISDTYNVGTTKLHYPMIATSYSYKSHRFQLGYGRTRQGINCAGGVCRVVPASRGLNFSYNFIF